MMMFINKIGLRTIKTALAIAISIVIAEMLHLEYPYFVAMTAVIAMDKTALNSIILAKNRIIGTFFGACIGILLSYVSRGNPILCAVGFILLTLVCNRFNLQSSISISALVMLSIMINKDTNPFFYGFNRLIDTMIGALIAFLVNTLILPYYNTEHINTTLDDLWNQINEIINNINKGTKSLDLKEVHKNIRSLELELDLYATEIIFKKKRPLVEQALSHMKTLKRIMVEADVLDTLDPVKDKDAFDFHSNRAKDIFNTYCEDFK